MMECSDFIVLQRLIDGDLEEAQAELVSHHAQSCQDCRANLAQAAADRAFVQNQLGIEDDGEDEASAAAIARIAARLPLANPSGGRTWWRRVLLAAAVAGLALLIPLPFGPAVGAAPGRILEEAAARQRMWMYQPNKILHWEVETHSYGVKDISDGRRRTLFWQNNGPTTLAQISRQFDPQGRTELATWRGHDGSTMAYRARKGRVIQSGPSTADIESAMPALSPDLQAALNAYLKRRTSMRTLDFYGRRFTEWLHRPSLWTSNGKVTLRERMVAQWGNVYQIRIENGPSPVNPLIRGAVHEYDIETSSLRLLRLRTTLTYSDGSVGVQDARWTSFREITAAEFDAQSPRDLIESGMRVVHLTPLEVAQSELRDMKPSALNR